jgi:hypothetical protein
MRLIQHHGPLPVPATCSCKFDVAHSAMIALNISNERATERAIGEEFLSHVDLCLRYSNEDPRINERLRALRRKIDRACPVLQKQPTKHS